VVIAAEHKLESNRIADYAGLARKSPYLASCLAIFLLSLAGIPPLAGFFAKYRVFMAAIETGQYLWLVLIAVGTTVISIYYYATVIKEMFITEKETSAMARTDRTGWQLSSPLTVAVLVGLLGTFVVGIFAQPFLELAKSVTQSFIY